MSTPLTPLATPGLGNRCLYFAALLSSGATAGETDAAALKTAVHRTIQQEIARVGPRADLASALRATDPATAELATDEVLPALADVVSRTIVVHEPNGAIEVEGYRRHRRQRLDIGYRHGHFYGLGPPTTVTPK